jgi:hypothetical protein
VSTAIAELKIDVKGARAPMRFAIYKPRWIKRMNAWGCRITFGKPFDTSMMSYGEDSTQALVHALKTASVSLYSSRLYKQKKLGLYGEYGRELGIPALHMLLDIAPYPF